MPILTKLPHRSRNKLKLSCVQERASQIFRLEPYSVRSGNIV